MILVAYGVQFLSKDFLPDDFHGDGEIALPTTDGVIQCTIKKEGLSDPKRFRPHKPIFAQPWAQNPSIGIYEFVDPYAEIRWPTYILLEARINLTKNISKKDHDLCKEIITRLREILWGSFNTMSILSSRPDERANCSNCKRIYSVEISDFDGNPLMSHDCNYVECYDTVPNGPGFIHLSIGPSLVWSQSIKFSNKNDIKNDKKIKEKVKRIKAHWNAHNELRDAKQHLSRNDIKGAIRSTSSAVEAALRFYCNEWDIKWPSKKGMQFNERIDVILKLSGRVPYTSIDPKASVDLLHLYRARSSMHEGDCYYKDINTSTDIQVNINIANLLFNSASEFVIWIDSQM